MAAASVRLGNSPPRRILLVEVYQPPSFKHVKFVDCIMDSFNKHMDRHDTMILMSDLNINLSRHSSAANQLVATIYSFGLAI